MKWEKGTKYFNINLMLFSCEKPCEPMAKGIRGLLHPYQRYNKILSWHGGKRVQNL